MTSTPTYADEKGGIQEIERVDSEGANNAAIDAFTPEEQKKIIRKVDMRLIPTLGFMYCVRLATSMPFAIEHILTMPQLDGPHQPWCRNGRRYGR
jgi:hypothetical protein